MSFNILNAEKQVDGVMSWNDRGRQVANIIKSYSDIAGLQEVLKMQRDTLQLLLGPSWGHIGVGRDDGAADGEFCSIFFLKDRFDVDENGTFWFSDRSDVAGSKGGETWGTPVQRRICTWGRFVERSTGRAFYLYNLHLSHNRGAAKPLLCRRMSVLLLQERIKERTHQEEPFVVTGDFNAVPTEGSSIGLMLGRTYFEKISVLDAVDTLQTRTDSSAIVPLIACKDSWVFLHSEKANQRTFHGGRGEGGRGWRLDYIFVQTMVGIDQADVLRFSTAGYYPSDHYPVTATLSLPDDK